MKHEQFETNGASYTHSGKGQPQRRRDTEIRKRFIGKTKEVRAEKIGKKGRGPPRRHKEHKGRGRGLFYLAIYGPSWKPPALRGKNFFRFFSINHRDGSVG
jgi:hypothetical protein